VLGPWQKSLFGVSASGLEVGPVILVPALLLAGYGIFEYFHGREDHRRRIGWTLIGAAVLIGLGEIGNNGRLDGIVTAGWGTIVAGLGGIGLFLAGVWTLRTPTLTP
jgi:hypothetical protein